MPKTYTITISGIDEILNRIEEEIKEAIEEEDADFLENLYAGKKYFSSLEENKKVTTFEEYYTLLENISKYLDDQYNIYDNGTYISLCDNY